VAHFKAVAARIFKEDGVVTSFKIHRAFEVSGARACRDFRNPVHVRRTVSPEGHSVLVGNMGRGFCDAEKLRDGIIGGLELQPSFNCDSAREPQGRQQCLVEGNNLREPRHSQINVIETSTYERGIDLMNTTYNFLDLTAKGRDENPDSPQDWVRYHDEYKGASKDYRA